MHHLLYKDIWCSDSHAQSKAAKLRKEVKGAQRGREVGGDTGCRAGNLQLLEKQVQLVL